MRPDPFKRQTDETTPPMLPSAPCISTEEFGTHIVTIQSDIREIKNALVGTRLAPDGIIPRLTTVEETVKGHDRKLLVWGAVLSAAGAVALFVKDFLH